MYNVYDLNVLWVGINASTGMIVVTDNNLYVPPSGASPTASAVLSQSLLYVNQSDAMGGK